MRNRQKGIGYANKKARTYANSIKKTNGDITCIASGKDVISHISNWAQTNFKVSISTIAVLNEIQKNEIDPELISIIRTIEKGNVFKYTSK